jgi:hypothetical protein
MHTNVEMKNFKERDYLEDLGVDPRIILKWTLKKQVVRDDVIHVAPERDTCGSL